MKNLILVFALLLVVGQAQAVTINTVATSFDSTITTMSEKIMASKSEDECLDLDGLNEDQEDQCMDQSYESDINEEIKLGNI